MPATASKVKIGLSLNINNKLTSEKPPFDLKK